MNMTKENKKNKKNNKRKQQNSVEKSIPEVVVVMVSV